MTAFKPPPSTGDPVADALVEGYRDAAKPDVRGVDATWGRLATIMSLVRHAAADMEQGVQKRQPWRVSLALSSLASNLPEAFRLLGRLDQLEEDGR